jgi:hypothetical protein
MALGDKNKTKDSGQVHLRNAEWKTEGRSHCELTSVSHNNEWLIQTDASEKKTLLSAVVERSKSLFHHQLWRARTWSYTKERRGLNND